MIHSFRIDVYLGLTSANVTLTHLTLAVDLESEHARSVLGVFGVIHWNAEIVSHRGWLVGPNMFCQFVVRGLPL